MRTAHPLDRHFQVSAIRDIIETNLHDVVVVFVETGMNNFHSNEFVWGQGMSMVGEALATSARASFLGTATSTARAFR